MGISLVTNLDWEAALPADLPEYSEGSEDAYRSALVELDDGPRAPAAVPPAAAAPPLFLSTWVWVALALAAGAVIVGGTVVLVLGRREQQ